MAITLAQLEALVWVSRLGSVSAAAVQLSVTQSSISLRLKELRASIGQPLFRKQGRRLTLSADGRACWPMPTRSSSTSKCSTTARAERITGVVRFGIIEALAVAALPGIISTLAERFQRCAPR